MTTSDPVRLFRLDGCRALVTGAGSGLGREIAVLFAQAGAAVAVVSKDPVATQATVAEITAGGAAAFSIPADISLEGEVTACVAAACEALGGPADLLVNAAGIYPRYRFTELTGADFDAIQAVNLRGAFLMMREIVKGLRKVGRGGAIVNISSIAAEVTVLHHNAAYTASKGGLNALTRSAAVEFAREGIRVNAILPIGIEGPGLARAKEGTVPMEGPGLQPDRLPIGRIATAREVALAALYLASPAASFVTGQSLAVDGGYLAA